MSSCGGTESRRSHLSGNALTTNNRFSARLVLTTIFSLLALLSGLAQPVLAAGERAYVFFVEKSGTNRGVNAKWQDENWTNVPCPYNDPGIVNRVNTFVNSLGEVAGTWVQLGYKERRYITGLQDQCVHEIGYYWERRYVEGGSYSYNRGNITSITPRAYRKFALVRKSTGCASGRNWCWHFRIGKETIHTCCGDQAELSDSPEASTQLECVDDTVDEHCPMGGKVAPWEAFHWKTSGGTWLSWSGRDGACVDNYREARGKWVSDTSAKGGYNVSMTDRIRSTPCQ